MNGQESILEAARMRAVGGNTLGHGLTRLLSTGANDDVYDEPFEPIDMWWPASFWPRVGERVGPYVTGLVITVLLVWVAIVVAAVTVWSLDVLNGVLR